MQQDRRMKHLEIVQHVEIVQEQRGVHHVEIVQLGPRAQELRIVQQVGIDPPEGIARARAFAVCPICSA